MLKIITTQDKEKAEEIRNQLAMNDNYCPCALQKVPDTKCMCKDFRDKLSNGETGACGCGLYIIVKND